jgi:RNA polymerase sigma-70 factor, ECF subfamily
MRSRRTARAEFEAMTLPLIDDLFGAAMRLARNRDDASDLVQDTYLRAWAAWGRFIEGSNARAWMIRILTNGYINGYRRRSSHKKFAARPGDEPIELLYGAERCARSHDPERAMTEPMLSDEVSLALGELPDDYRTVVVLADLEGMKYKDIADTLGCPVGTVMSRLFRARRMLEERLAGFARTEYALGRAA